MKLRDLIEMVDKAYPHNDDNYIVAYFDEPDVNHGDSLARFIAIELKETYDEDASDEDQIEEAVRVLSSGADDLRAIAHALRLRS